MHYQQQRPPACLRNYVRYIWTLESDAADPALKTVGPLVDGCPGLIFQPAEAGQFYDQSHMRLPEIFTYGQTIKRTSLQLTGQFKTIGICLFPNTLQAIFGVNARELTDACLDLKLIAGGLAEQLVNTSSIPDQIAVLSDYLLSQIRRMGKPVDLRIHYALDQLVTSKGNRSLTTIQRSLGLSERSFERRFDQQVGISPKLFSRICRFQAALNQLKTADYGKLSDIAFENGYADQSHFIRSFREFTGYTPQQFQKQTSDTVNNFPSLIR